MSQVDFDKALSDFLDDDECETASEAVYELIRRAFGAGWESAMRVKQKPARNAPKK